jgi:hypothetical protein
MGILVARSVKSEEFEMLRNWLRENSGMLFYTALLGVAGVMFLAQPARMIRWTLRQHPELSGDPQMLITARLVGLGILCVVLFVLAKL